MRVSDGAVMSGGGIMTGESPSEVVGDAAAAAAAAEEEEGPGSAEVTKPTWRNRGSTPPDEERGGGGPRRMSIAGGVVWGGGAARWRVGATTCVGGEEETGGGMGGNRNRRRYGRRGDGSCGVGMLSLSLSLRVERTAGSESVRCFVEKKYGARGAHRGACAHPGASPLLGHPTPHDLRASLVFRLPW
jgi:hypothetical protein